MSLFDNLNKREKQELGGMTEKQGSIQDIVTDVHTIMGLGITPKRKIEDYLKSAVGWVYACVDSISNEIGNIELKLMKVSNGGDVEEVDNHEILDLLSRANSNTTKFDLFYLTQQYLELAGEAPWFLELRNGKPINIFLLRPDRLTVKPPKDKNQLIGGYTYKIFKGGGVQELSLEPEEVLFLKYPDPVRPFRGKGTLEASVTTFDMDEQAEKYNLKFFSNSATPNSVLKTDKKLSKESIRKLRNEINRKHVGIDNAQKTLILEGGLDWKPMALSQREMDFIETMRFTRDKILAIFRVPRTVLGITEDVNRANAEASDFVFAKRTVKPKMQKLIEMLNEFLVPMFDEAGNLFLTYEDPVPENTELKLQTAGDGITKGFLTINEARELLGYEAVEGGDDVLAPATPNVPAQRMAGQANGRKPKKRKTQYDKTYTRSLRKRTSYKRKARALTKIIRGQITTNVTSVVYSQLLTKAEAKKRERLLKATTLKSYTGSKKQKKEFQIEQLRVGDEFEKRFSDQMAHIFKEQRDIIISKLPEKADNRLLPEKKETEKTVEKLTPIVAFVIAMQSAKAFQLLGQENRLNPSNNDNVSDYLVDRVFKFSHDITVETNRQIGKVLADATTDGLSIPQTTVKIREAFGKMQTFRAERIARSEIIRATSFATEEAFVVSEVVEAKEWLTFIDERTDQACLAMNGKTLGLGKDYFKQGDSFHGVSLNYEDISGPPLHSNCRCTIVPVVVA